MFITINLYRKAWDLTPGLSDNSGDSHLIPGSSGIINTDLSHIGNLPRDV